MAINSGLLELMHPSIKSISRLLPMISCNIAVLIESCAKVGQTNGKTTQNHNKSADSGAKTRFFPCFWHHYRHFSMFYVLRVMFCVLSPYSCHSGYSCSKKINFCAFSAFCVRLFASLRALIRFIRLICGPSFQCRATFSHSNIRDNKLLCLQCFLCSKIKNHGLHRFHG